MSTPQKSKLTVVLLIGKPCSGKGGVGKAIHNFHGYKPFVMRDLIDAKAEKDPEFKVIAEACKASRSLVTEEYTTPIIQGLDFATAEGYDFYDGIPRTPQQAALLGQLLGQLNDIHVILIEFVASNEFVDGVFLATLKHKDRADRTDNDLIKHRKGVSIYCEHLDRIVEVAAQNEWTHRRIDATQSLACRVNLVERIVGLPVTNMDVINAFEEEHYPTRKPVAN